MNDAKRMFPNLDWYSAVAYHLMGIPIDLFTPLVCDGADGRLVRARDRAARRTARLFGRRPIYTGPENLKFVPIARAGVDIASVSESNRTREPGHPDLKGDRVSSHISNERPAPDQVLTDIADYALELRDQERAGLHDRALLPDRHAGLRTGGARVSGLHQAAGADRAGNGGSEWRARAGHELSARSGAGGVQHRRHDSLARLQRHLAGGGVGTSFRQSGRNSGHGRLALAHGDRRGQACR